MCPFCGFIVENEQKEMEIHEEKEPIAENNPPKKPDVKYCNNCGAEMPLSTNFCTACGSNDFSTETFGIKSIQTNVDFIPPVELHPVAKKKGLRWWQIVLIVFGSIFALLIVVGILASINEEHDTYDDFSYISEEELSTEYTKGVLENGTYKNEWMNVTFNVSEEFPETTEAYSLYETGNVRRSVI